MPSKNNNHWWVESLILVACLVSVPLISRAAEKRVALVIGNSAYQHVSPLDNPTQDAKLIAGTLMGLGFVLIGGDAQLNLDKAAMDQAVQTFGTKLLDADVALFYYAGHGVQISGSNYLVPINANPVREADVDFQMLDVNLVLHQMESSRIRLNLVILDACRNNPFGGRHLRGTQPGLAEMRAPEGTLIAYATQPGNVAQDGLDGHSPYSKALAAVIRRPGLDVLQTFNAVGLAVDHATGKEQQPWFASSPIEGNFYFTVPTVPAPATTPSVSARPAPPDVHGSLHEAGPANPTQTYYVSTLAGHPRDGSKPSDGRGSAAVLSGVLRGIAVTSEGSLYVGEESIVIKVSPSGDVTTVAGVYGESANARMQKDGVRRDARFDFISGLTLDPDENLLVADRDTIRKVTPEGVVTTIAGHALWNPRNPHGNGNQKDVDGIGSQAQFFGIDGITSDHLGNAYITSGTYGVLRRITPDGAVTTLGVTGPAYLNDGAMFGRPEGIAIDHNGHLYVSDSFACTVWRVTQALVRTPFAGQPAKDPRALYNCNYDEGVDGTAQNARLLFARGVATDSAGNVYLADWDSIRKITPGGIVTTIAGGTRLQHGWADGPGRYAQFSDSYLDLTVDKNGTIYVADSGNAAIRKITVVNRNVTH